MHSLDELREKQSLPLDLKINMTKNRVREWIREFGENGVYISFSGGKDSTVLLDLIRNKFGYNDVKAMFVDVPTQYPEIRRFVKTFDNVDILRPKIGFFEVCEKYGFPLISKEVSQKVSERRSAHRNGRESYVDRQIADRKNSRFDISKYTFLFDAPFEISQKCCNIMKKNPAKKYEKETGRKPILAQMAEESLLRESNWLKNGCNAFNSKRQSSNPMSFWTENDVLEYIYRNDLPICSVYGKVIPDEQMTLFDTGYTKYKTTGCQRTGCVLCGFGCHHLEPNGKSKFENLHESHPQMYNLLDVCKNNGITYKEAIEWINKQDKNINIRI